MNRVILMTLMIVSCVSARAELVQQFKDPAFNGQGWSSHALTIDSIERSRKDAIESKKKSELAAIDAAAQNTPLARFMSLFQSQVYAQLSTQLSNNLFQNKCNGTDGLPIAGCVNPTTGTFKLDGNTVTWNKTVTDVVLTVVDAVGSITTVRVPVASFAF